MALVAQLESLALLLSDFNAYQTFWDCNSIVAKGEVSDLLLSTYALA
jgi:hypothetical protein